MHCNFAHVRQTLRVTPAVEQASWITSGRLRKSSDYWADVMLSALEQLEKWYVARCDGLWEHTWGVEIGTLDNPGWRVRINLNETPQDGAALEMVNRAQRPGLDLLLGC